MAHPISAVLVCYPAPVGEKNAADPPISHMRDHHDAVPVTGTTTAAPPSGTHAIGAAPRREHLARLSFPRDTNFPRGTNSPCDADFPRETDFPRDTDFP